MLLYRTKDNTFQNLHFVDDYTKMTPTISFKTLRTVGYILKYMFLAMICVGNLKPDLQGTKCPPR